MCHLKRTAYFIAHDLFVKIHYSIKIHVLLALGLVYTLPIVDNLW